MDAIRTARAWFGSVLFLGLAAPVAAWLAAPPASPWPVIAAAAASAVAAPFTLRLPRVGEMSMAFAIVCASLLMIGIPAACLAAAVAGGAVALVRSAGPIRWHRVAYSAAALSLASGAGGGLFLLAGGRVGSLRPAGDWPALLVAIAGFFLVNSALVAGVTGLAHGSSILRRWRDDHLWTAPAYLAGGAIGWALVLSIRHFGPVAVMLSIPSLYVLHFSLRIYTDSLRKEKRHGEAIADLYLSVIEALALAIDARDRASTRRLRRVQTLAVEIGRLMGLSAPEIEALRAGALLHDIGKLAVPEYILRKPGKLTPDEFEKMAVHPRIGAEILERVRFPYPLASVVRSHHERFDGAGYPDGLRGSAIPRAARILSVVSALEALTSDRPYRRPFSRDEAIALIRGEAGKAFDPRVVDLVVGNLDRIETLTLVAPEVKAGAPVPRRDTGAIGDNTNALSAATMANISSAHREVYDLFEIARGMAKSLNLDETLTFIAGRVARLIPYRCLVVYLFDRERRLLRARFADGPAAERLVKVEVPLGERMSGWAALHRLPLAATTGAGAEGRPDGARSDLDELLDAGVIEPLHNAIVVPLLDGDDLLGVLALYDLAGSPYTGDHLKTISIVARHVGGGVKNALLYEQTQQNALTDPLTKLPNARYLFGSFEKEIGRARTHGTPLSIVVLDLNSFKEVNDRFGHPAGDRVLRGVARAIRSQLRPADTCVRYAGDEFVLTVPGVGQEGIGAVQKRVEAAIANHKFAVARGKALRVSVSMGSATYPGDGQTMDGLIAVADARMYDVKFSRRRRPGNTPPPHWFIGRRDLPAN